MNAKSDLLIADLVADMTPVRPMRAWQLLVALVGAWMVSVAISLMLFGMRPDILVALGTYAFWVRFGIAIGMAVSSAVIAVALSRPGGRPPLLALAALVASVGLFVMPGFAIMALNIHERPFNDGSAHNCLETVLVNGLPALLAMTWWLRRAAPVMPVRAALVAAFGAGAIGNFAFMVACANDTLVHSLVWHGCSLLMVTLGGALMLPRVLPRW